MNQRTSTPLEQTTPQQAGSVNRSVDLAAQLKARMDASDGSITLDRDLASALWAQLLANADLLRGFIAQKEAALNIDGTVFQCSSRLHDVLLPILQDRLTQMAQKDVDRDLAELRANQKG